MLVAFASTPIAALGSDLRPCECHRFGSPANQAGEIRRHPLLHARRHSATKRGRRPISTDQPPRRWNVSCGNQPPSKLARRDVDQHLVHAHLPSQSSASPPPSSQSLLLALKAAKPCRSISTLPPWKPILPFVFPHRAPADMPRACVTTDRLRIVIHHLAKRFHPKQAQQLEARHKFARPRASALSSRSRCSKLVHGVAFLRESAPQPILKQHALPFSSVVGGSGWSSDRRPRPTRCHERAHADLRLRDVDADR